MNCFQIIKSILDEEYDQIPGNEIEKDARINEACKVLSQDYKQLLAGKNVSYLNPITRFAYIYTYVTCHANLVCTLINEYKNLGEIFDAQKVKIACIGGGPGSDFLGIIKYVMTKNKSPNITFNICDREKTWAESWNGVDDKVEHELRTSTSYLSLDVTVPDDWKHHTKYFQSDLFTMIYFMSEVFALRESADDYFNNLFRQAKVGAVFLFVDNNNPNFYNWFDKLAMTHNIDIIERKECRMNMPLNEEKSDLGRYFIKFNNPRLTANVAYRIARKK